MILAWYAAEGWTWDNIKHVEETSSTDLGKPLIQHCIQVKLRGKMDSNKSLTLIVTTKLITNIFTSSQTLL